MRKDRYKNEIQNLEPFGDWTYEDEVLAVKEFSDLSEKLGRVVSPHEAITYGWQKPCYELKVKNVQSERTIQEYIYHNLLYLCDLTYGQDELLKYVSMEAQVGGRRIDILAYDYFNKEFIVIEIKKEKGHEKVLGQIQRYMGYIDKYKCQDNGKKVRGVIVAEHISDDLRYAVRAVDNIKLVEFSLGIRFDEIKKK